MRREIRILVWLSMIFLPMLVSVDGFAQERIVYRCLNADGVIVFSDKECEGLKSRLKLNVPTDEDLTRQKAEHDAKVLQDKALANSIEASRLATEQAGRNAQDQQMQVNRAAAERYEQERSQRNSAVTSSPSVTQSAPILTVP